MKVCTHCGERFQPRYENSKLCTPCFFERESMFEFYPELEREILDLRRALARTPAPSVIPSDILRVLIQLAHPDRHGNSPASNRATAWLLDQR